MANGSLDAACRRSGVGKAVRRCVPASALVTTYGGRRLVGARAGFRAARVENTSEAGGHRSLSGEGFPCPLCVQGAVRSQPVVGSVALALNVGLVAGQPATAGWKPLVYLCFCVLPLLCYQPDQRSGQ